jgi:hypothetical protein
VPGSFWTQNELLWDRDVTVLGGLAGVGFGSAATAWALRGGLFGLPDGAWAIHGTMAAGQLTVDHRPRSELQMVAGAGYFQLAGSESATRLREGNGARDYRIGSLSGQVRVAIRPNGLRLGYVRVGADGLHNFERYDPASTDSVAARSRQERSGLVAQAALGSARAAEPTRGLGAWELTYTYARIEKLAVNASFAQDDWMRWGSAGQTDASDFRGDELGLRAWLTNQLDLHLRAYGVRSLTSIEDGRRIRLDLNLRL